MPCAPLYLENSDKARFSGLKKRVGDNYVLNKVEYPRTASMVQSLLLNYQADYNYNEQSQYQGVSNQLIFSQSGKIGYDEGETKDDKQNPWINFDHITCNDCREKGQYTGKGERSTQKNIK